jgi:hypothetical protein
MTDDPPDEIPPEDTFPVEEDDSVADTTPAPAPQPGPAPTDDADPPPALLAMAESVARADALKGVATATDDLYSTDPAKAKARTAIETGYAKAAAANPAGDLRARYIAADRDFKRAAADIRPRLDDWIGTWLTAGALKALLQDGAQIAKRLDARYGPRERTRADTAATATRWAARYADWSKPDTKIAALIGEYSGDINPLLAASNTGPDADLAIFRFWFEVAPKHLQLRTTKPSENDAPGITKLRNALAPYPALLARLLNATERADGGVYLIDPAQLAQHRRDLLQSWQDSAELQAKAEAAFKLRPDDAASLKARNDKLKEDGWIKDARALFDAS